MKISELITLLEKDKEKYGDLKIHYIDIRGYPIFDGEEDEGYYKLS